MAWLDGDPRRAALAERTEEGRGGARLERKARRQLHQQDGQLVPKVPGFGQEGF
jgi:hypothetical protein